eukprot:428233_1
MSTSLWNLAVNTIYGTSVNDSSGDTISLQKKHSNDKQSNSNNPTMKALFDIIENQKKTIEHQLITIQKQQQIQNQSNVQILQLCNILQLTITELQNKNKCLKDKISEQKEIWKLEQKKKDKLQKQLNESYSANESITNQLILTKQETNYLKEQIKLMQTNINEIQNGNNFIEDTNGSEDMNPICDLQNENNRLKEYISRLEEGHSEKTELQNDQNEQLAHKTDELLNQYKTLQVELDNKEQNNIMLNHYLKICRGTVAELKSNITILKHETDEERITWNERLCQFKEMFNAAKTKANILTKHKKQSAMRITVLEKELNEMKVKLKTTESEKQKLKTECDVLKDRLKNNKIKYSWYYVKKDKFVEVNEILAQRLDLLKVSSTFEYKQKDKLSKSKFTKSSTDLVSEKCVFGSSACIVRRRTFCVLKWEWKDDDGIFKPYPMKTRKAITYARNGSVIGYKTNKFEYKIKKISNCKAEQRNVKTDKIREVRSNKIDSDHVDICSVSQYYSQGMLLTIKFVHSLFYNTLNGLECKIDSIEDVMDKSKNLHYELLLKDKCDKYMQSRDQIEGILWHGSSFKALTCIIKSGFDRSYNVRGKYGRGSYFASTCYYSISNGYCNKHRDGYYYILVCKVICGKYIAGNAKMNKIPKQKDGEEYDALVDRMDNPSIFVSWRDYMSLPLYLIKFKFK